MGTPGTNLEFKLKLEEELKCCFPYFDVDWETIYKLILCEYQNNNKRIWMTWAFLLNNAQSSEEVQLAVDNMTKLHDPKYGVLGTSQIIKAIYRNDIQSIKILFDSSIFNTSNTASYFNKAIALNRLDIIELLLSFGNVQSNNLTLGNALYAGNLKVIELLLNSPKIDPTLDNNSAVHYIANLLKRKLNELQREEELDEYIGKDHTFKKKLETEVNKHTSILALLLDDKRIWNSLSYSDRMEYSGMLGG